MSEQVRNKYKRKGNVSGW